MHVQLFPLVKYGSVHRIGDAAGDHSYTVSPCLPPVARPAQMTEHLLELLLKGRFVWSSSYFWHTQSSIPRFWGIEKTAAVCRLPFSCELVYYLTL